MQQMASNIPITMPATVPESPAELLTRAFESIYTQNKTNNHCSVKIEE
jgi:hypothetical protein